MFSDKLLDRKREEIASLLFDGDTRAKIESLSEQCYAANLGVTVGYKLQDVVWLSTRMLVEIIFAKYKLSHDGQVPDPLSMTHQSSGGKYDRGLYDYTTYRAVKPKYVSSDLIPFLGLDGDQEFVDTFEAGIRFAGELTSQRTAEFAVLILHAFWDDMTPEHRMMIPLATWWIAENMDDTAKNRKCRHVDSIFDAAFYLETIRASGLWDAEYMTRLLDASAQNPLSTIDGYGAMTDSAYSRRRIDRLFRNALEVSSELSPAVAATYSMLHVGAKLHAPDTFTGYNAEFASKYGLETCISYIARGKDAQFASAWIDGGFTIEQAERLSDAGLNPRNAQGLESAPDSWLNSWEHPAG